MSFRVSIVGAAAMFWIAGCAHHPASSTARAQGDGFESSHDPPINAQTYFAAGQLAETQGRLQQAVGQYERSLSLKPNYLDPMYRLGVVYAELKDYKRAIETWNRYIATSNGSATAYSNLGFCQELAGNPAAAEAAYLKGIEQDPHNEPCHINYGLMLARRGSSGPALLQLQTVLPPAKAHYDLASVYETLGQKQQAREEYRKAIELDPQLQDAKTRLAALSN